ncbi:MAG: hypothetical protein JWM11_6456 [Planctomycetaceae bacterium]|nr:hypothetical protein [Planctomycetaceae bacterium]
MHFRFVRHSPSRNILSSLFDFRGICGKKKVSGTVVLFFQWSAARSQSAFQIQAFDNLVHPVGIAVWCTASDAAAECRHFRFRLWFLNMTQPETWTRNGPLAEHLSRKRVTLLSVIQARPLPFFCQRAEVGSQGIPFDVPANCQKVIVALNRK